MLSIKQIHKIRFIVIFVPLFCALASSLQGQQNNSLYYMTAVPQSGQLNPATQPRCGFYLGFPGLSSWEVTAGNSAVGFDDVFIYKPSLDSLVYFLTNDQTRSNFLKKWGKNENLFAEVRGDLFSLGFRINNTYLSFNIGERLESFNSIPHDLASVVVEGNIGEVSPGAVEKAINMSTLGVNASYYHDCSLGISHEYGKLTLGLRARVLFGIANVTTKNSEVSIRDGGVDENGTSIYRMNSQITLNSSVPRLSIIEKADGTVDSLKFDDIKTARQARNVLLNTRNMGLGMDLGMSYKLTDKFSVSMSILDLGYIRWKNNLHSFKQDASYDMKGMIISLNDSVNGGDALMDTLKDHFTYEDKSGSYTTYLSPKLYAGVLFQPIKLVGLGLLTRQQYINKSILSQYTFSLNIYPANAFNFTLSYTIVDKMYDNFGFGMSFKLGPLQAYILSDRLPLYWHPDKGKVPIVPAYAKEGNFHLGLNLVLGYNHRYKKLNKDKPLVDL